jgi:hypothetical protein
MPATMTRRPVLKWLSIRDTILTQPRQGIKFAEDADHGPICVSITGYEGSGNFSHAALQLEAAFFEGILQRFGRFKFLVAQFGIAPDFITNRAFAYTGMKA